MQKYSPYRHGFKPNNETWQHVVFCGAPAIAEQLKRACEKHSDSKQALFRLHKENF